MVKGIVRRIVRRNTRRFYDYTKHNYVSLSEIAQYIKKKEVVEIINMDGADVSNGTLLQILIKRAEALDTNQLAKLVESIY